jgi:predicted GIY-YIG superfamily endonuclease
MRIAIYVLKMNDTVIYVGKSHQPQNRYNLHVSSDLKGKFNKMEIIDEYNDPEQDWIKHFEKQNIILENKNRSVEVESWWKIGDIIDSSSSNIKIKNKRKFINSMLS